ncbi:MAG TPA: bifunctional phosphoribosylaminoimidazolecarboxamide formyltransferase/IMP cyclohydrolase [Chitinophagaceae bacterium]|nr:bifunctional phosphoribosylaminoimidazolecarboxamide formyltransferase/IMP cyclohydrolase [Chitinophagaceae bacterium]
MYQKISSALISVFYKDGLEPILKTLQANQVQIFTTGGTQKFIEDLGYSCTSVESITQYPSILGGRVKTLHPKVFGGILGRRNLDSDLQEMEAYQIPKIDLVIVDLYPFEETLASTNDEKSIIEKIDIGGPSMIRAAAKNFQDVAVLASKQDYHLLNQLLEQQQGALTLNQRKSFAAKAFEIVMHYDIAIADYFNRQKKDLRYGENPHQNAHFIGNLDKIFNQIHGKEISYNNLVDIDAAYQLLKEFHTTQHAFFAIIKHTNVCGAAIRETGIDAWKAALQGDTESAFGGILLTNGTVDEEMAQSMNELFFEVLIANDFSPKALEILKQKKNRILLMNQQDYSSSSQMKSILNGMLVQENDSQNEKEWKEVGGRNTTEIEKKDLIFANRIAKHLKSNAIAIVKNEQLIGKGCGQTSRIDALKQAIEKANSFEFDLHHSVIASDAFFPFDDCVKIAHQNQITAFIQPGGSVRDQDSIQYCQDNQLAMVLTGVRHFKH